jgi:DNA-binding transcriptional MerR regulator
VENPAKQIRGLATPAVAALAHVPPSTLHHWVATGLCGPSLVAAGGKRATAYWSIRDVVAVRAIASLRRVGCPLQTVRQVAAELERHWDSDLADAVLYWDGRDVVSVDQAGDVVSLMRERGQAVIREAMIHVATFPLHAWIQETSAVSVVLDPGKIADRRAIRLTSRGAEGVSNMRATS